eukprot:6186625-Pyramimonas_sp.AAC.1
MSPLGPKNPKIAPQVITPLGRVYRLTCCRGSPGSRWCAQALLREWENTMDDMRRGLVQVTVPGQLHFIAE